MSAWMTILAAFDCPALAASGNGDFSVLVVPLVILLAGCSFVWHFRRSRTLLDQWAEQNGLEILESDYRNFFKGPKSGPHSLDHETQKLS
jgi:hypothetical protein